MRGSICQSIRCLNRVPGTPPPGWQPTWQPSAQSQTDLSRHPSNKLPAQRVVSTPNDTPNRPMRSLRAAATRAICLPRRSPTRCWCTRMAVGPRWRATASTAAQRTRRRALLGDVASADLARRTRGGWGSARPSCTGAGRARTSSTSPISATKIAASTGPTPGMAWTAW